jgi:hypothetical protein
LGSGPTTPPSKKEKVTDTRKQKDTISTLGEDEAPSIGLMMASGESRKEPTGLKPSTSNKRSLRIASWNVRTLYEAGKCKQALHEMRRYSLHMLGVSESHWIQFGQKRFRTGELILFSGRDQAPHREGVALILSKAAQKTLRGWEAHGPRIIMASFSSRNKRTNINIVQIYAPTNDAEEEEKEEFYNRLQGVLDKLPSKDVNIMMGDANAKVGADNTGYEETMGKHGLGEMNNNGERFANLCAFNGLVIGGTVFPHKRIHKATWVSPDGNTENQIDHFCIARKYRRTMENVRVLRGADIGSDHHLLMAVLKLRLKRYHNNDGYQQPKYQVSLLQGNKKEEFRTSLRNKYQPLELEEKDVESHWNHVKEVITDTCEEVLGRKEYKHKEWISQTSLDRIAERRAKKEAINNSKTRAECEVARQEYAQAAKVVKRSIKKDKEQFVTKLAERAEAAAQSGQTRVLYQTTKILAGKYNQTSAPVKDKQGNTIFEKEAQNRRWVEHFETLLNRPPPDNPPDIMPARRDLDISCEPPSKEEIAKATAQLNSNKAAGPDAIPPEALKADVATTVEVLHGLFEKVWTEEQFPKDWKEGHLVKLPKKGDLSNCNNYRGITLLSNPGKVFNRVMLERMKEAVDKHLRDQQAGFRKNRSCTDQIATLRIIIEQSLEWNSSLWVNFIDYEKAFDSVDRPTLWKILRHYGIPQKIVTLIEKMYDGTSCKVLNDGQLTEGFEIRTGVRQGCLLSPFLFIIAVDWLLKETTSGRKNGIQWTLWTQLDDLDFADDLALLAHTHEQMQNKTTDLSTLSKSIGLRIHPGKSKVLKVKTTATEPILVENRPLDVVDNFTYLGSVVDDKGGTAADIKARIGKARTAFTNLNNIWKDRAISTRTKVMLFNSNVKSVLLFGSETWSLTQTWTKKLQSFINGCLRKILHIRWPDSIQNVALWERTGQKPVEIEIGQRRWRWIGHTLRKPCSSTTRQALQWNPQGQRNRGRPRTTWRRVMEDDLKRGGLQWKDAVRSAQDRKEWKSVVRGLYPDTG